MVLAVDIVGGTLFVAFAFALVLVALCFCPRPSHRPRPRRLVLCPRPSRRPRPRRLVLCPPPSLRFHLSHHWLLVAPMRAYAACSLVPTCVALCFSTVFAFVDVSANRTTSELAASGTIGLHQAIRAQITAIRERSTAFGASSANYFANALLQARLRGLC